MCSRHLCEGKISEPGKEGKVEVRKDKTVYRCMSVTSISVELKISDRPPQVIFVKVQ